MKNINGLWLPDHEEHLQQFAALGKYGKWTYQVHKMLAAMEHIKACRTAVDVGGHCGLWSKEMVKIFNQVHAFEPIAAHRECFIANVEHTNYTLHSCALGEKEGSIKMHTSNGSSGDSWVNGEGDIPMHTLDSFDLQDVDFIKIDCEGYELFVLRGGEEMLKRCKPVVIVEQKKNHGKKFGLKDTEAVDYLQSLGYELKHEMSGDYILVAT